jgi:hypothetical protein
LGWLISAVCPTLRKHAPGFHTDALLFRLLVALLGGRDLLLFAKHLFSAARTMVAGAAVIRGLAGAPRYGIKASKRGVLLR